MNRIQFTAVWLKLSWLLACLMAGCSTAATASPSTKHAGSIYSLVAIVDFDDASLVPELPDDFKKPSPGDTTPDTTGRGAVPQPSAKELPVVLGYSPKWCSVCPAAKRDSAKSTSHRFVWEDDESKFPQWIRDDLKKNDQRPSAQRHGFPYLEWKNSTGWWFTWGWANLAEFNRRASNTTKPVDPKTVAVEPRKPPSTSANESAAAVFSTGYWWNVAELRNHLANEHGIDTSGMSAEALAAAHNGAHSGGRRKRRHG